MNTRKSTNRDRGCRKAGGDGLAPSTAFLQGATFEQTAELGEGRHPASVWGGEYQQPARRPQAGSDAGKPGVQGREPKQFLKVDFLARTRSPWTTLRLPWLKTGHTGNSPPIFPLQSKPGSVLYARLLCGTWLQTLSAVQVGTFLEKGLGYRIHPFGR